MNLYGRQKELAGLDALIGAAADGRGQSLVLRGEAGIGKSSLLAHAEDEARRRGFTVLRAVGWEAERGLAFAALHQLLRPVLDRAGQLPQPQADALGAAVGTGTAEGHDRFRVGLAVLSLLAEVAEDAPVLCLVDDAQWIDEPSVDALLFAARRLGVERVALLFAARTTQPEGDAGFPAAGLPQLPLSRLGRDDALALLAGLDVPAAVRNRVLEESLGNPLALREFGAAGPAADGRQPSPGHPLPAAERVLAAYRGRVLELPERTRLMLLIAASDSRSTLRYVLAAAARLDAGLADLAAAEQRGLVAVVGEFIEFRHPLIRTAAYTAAPLATRVAVHEALAATSGDPDCRARHLASAATGPDEAVAAELEAAARRAMTRGGPAAAAETYAEAARLTPETEPRVRRLTAAAWAAQQAGHAERAAELAEEAYGQTADANRRAELAYIRSFWLFEKDAAAEAAAVLLAHAPDSPAHGPTMTRTAATYAWLGGDVAAVHRAATLLGRHGNGNGDDRDRSVRGLAHLAEDDFVRGLPLLTELLTDAPTGSPARLQAISAGSHLTDATQLPLVAEEIDLARREGLIGRLPYLLHVLARHQIYAGNHREAEATVAEAATIARDTGLTARVGRLNNLLGRIPAIEGDEDRVRSLAVPAMTAGGAYGATALALLDLGLGRYEDVLTRLAEARVGVARYSAALLFATADEVEAAVRLGMPERAAAPARRFAAWAAASGQPWARAVALRNEALLTEATGGEASGRDVWGGDVSGGEAGGGARGAATAGGAEGAYAEAVRLHAEPWGRPFEQARTELLFGEHLRRERRRTEARTHLRTALKLFDSLAATPWADRARAELRAAGEVQAAARATAPDPADRLTPQELQVVRLAADGTSSRDIAARLFLSPRTVEYHLYKAYPKLGVTSRRELPAALAAVKPTKPVG